MAHTDQNLRPAAITATPTTSGISAIDDGGVCMLTAFAPFLADSGGEEQDDEFLG